MSDKIKSIKNIELSSLCNMSCDYCLSPHIKEQRKPGLMTLETFKKVADKIELFFDNGTQGEIWLHGTGESLLNKDLPKMVAYLKSKVTLPVYISTNGLLIDDEIVKKLKISGIDRIDVSPHDEESALKAWNIIIGQDIRSTINYGVQDKKFNWANQLDIEVTAPNQPACPWLQNKECFILHDGSVVNCCFDAYGTNIIGHIENVENLEIKPFELCKSCNHGGITSE